MCGIRLLVLEQTIDASPLIDTSPRTKKDKVISPHNTPPFTFIKRRGPDGCGEHVLQHGNRRIVFQASVLRLRDAFVSQPVFAEPPFVAWNGELYQQQQQEEEEEEESNTILDTIQEVWQDHVSDTTTFADSIRSIIVEGNENDSLIIQQIARYCSTLINAEYAFCVVTQTAVYYGRDSLGRRSLLVHHSLVNDASPTYEDSGIAFELASVATDTTCVWTEVSPGLVHGYTWRDNQHMSPKPFGAPLPALSLYPTTFEEAALQLMQLLQMAVRRRIPLHTGSVAILFSGGLDSVVLAALTLKVVPPSFSVMLVNVSFVETHSSPIDTTTTELSSQAADTRAALLSYQELRHLFPEHSNVRFIPHQVDWNEIQNAESHVRALIYPKDGTMDLNIATALWFAAQVATPARVLLSGLGADEQMGGYGRHRIAWNQGGDDALRKELDLDLKRLWERNLGRDDRVLSDHGTEARYPFLDTNVMAHIAALPLHLVCTFNLPPGQGDKRILRRVAECLGVQTASSMVKRAIQFGSRISHVCDKKRFGSRRKATAGASNGLKQQKNTNNEK